MPAGAQAETALTRAGRPCHAALPPGVHAQKQPGYCCIRAALPLGDLTAAQANAAAAVAEHYGQGLLRATQLQDLLIPGVPAGQVSEAVQALESAGLRRRRCAGPKLVACAGAATCRLGLCRSRDLATAITRELERRGIPAFGNRQSEDKRRAPTESGAGCQVSGAAQPDGVPGRPPPLSPLPLTNNHKPPTPSPQPSGTPTATPLEERAIFISGCPNSCGNHHTAALGFEGKARRVQGRMMPFYEVYAGARVQDGEAQLARKLGAVPARAVPGLVAEALAAGARTPEALAPLISARTTPPDPAPEEYFRDLGAAEPFAPAGQAAGEDAGQSRREIEATAKDAKARAEG